MTSARHERRTTGAGEGGDRHRTRGRNVRAWALAQGLIADADAVELICIAKAARGGSAGDFDRWTIVDVEELLWVELVASCNEVGRPVPERLAETLWTYLGYLAGSGSLVAPSDTLPTLRSPLVAYGGLGINGRRRPVRPPRRASRPRSRSQAMLQPPARSVASPVLVADDALAGDGLEELATIIPLRPRRALVSVGEA